MSEETYVVFNSKHTWPWLSVDSSYKNSEVPFTDMNGPINLVNTMLKAFCFFYAEVMNMIVNKMECYAASYICGCCNQKPESRIHSWRDIVRRTSYCSWTSDVDRRHRETQHKIFFQ
jgi:hypothetical protein